MGKRKEIPKCTYPYVPSVPDCNAPVALPFLQRLKDARQAHDEAGLNHCDHPLCTSPLPPYFPKSGPRFCESHCKELSPSSDHVRVYASDADLMPDDPICSRDKCTVYLYEKDQRRCDVQWLFVCDTCKKNVCCFCAKSCHAAGHVFSDVTYLMARCGRTEILEARKYFVVREWTTDGKCVRANKII
jgi:hypothetical protein